MITENRFTQFIVCASLSFCVAPGTAAEVSGYIVLTTDYVFRGVSQSDEHGALQLGADVALSSGWYFGVWGSTTDIGGGTSRHRDLETNYYLGYALDVSRKWTVGGNVVAYSYPGAKGQTDYDYTEYSLTANFNDQLWFEYSHSPDIYHTGETTENWSLYFEVPVGRNLTLGTGAGLYDVSNLIAEDYTYWQVGLTRPFDALTVDLRYHDTSRWLPIFSSPERADARLVLSARFQF